MEKKPVRLDEEERESSSESSLSRRDFLKIAGVAGAVVGTGAGLGGLLAACGSEETTTTTAGATTTAGVTTTAASTATTGGATTTVSAAAEVGAEIKLGDVIPQTGALSIFGVPEQWSIALFTKTIGDGIVLGDGKKHLITVVTADSQSSPDRAGQVTGDLITNSKVAIVTSSGTPDTINPASVQAEALGCPMLANFNPYETFIKSLPTPTTELKWVYGSFFTFKSSCEMTIPVLESLNTNKVVGFLAANNSDGQGLASIFPAQLTAAGFKVVDPGLYTPMSEDFTAQITEFKSNGCELMAGVNIPPDFANAFKQSLQQGWHPADWDGTLGISTPSEAEALGAVGVLTGLPWHRKYDFTDALTGMTCDELAADYEQTTNQQWSCFCGCHGKLTWAVDVLQRATDPTDANSIVDAIKKTKTDLIIGHVDFTEPVDPNGNGHIHPNVYCGAYNRSQVVKSADGAKYPFDLAINAIFNAGSGTKTVPILPFVYS
jgi:branched-chain amino acid transport system substrate-binding protein